MSFAPPTCRMTFLRAGIQDQDRRRSARKGEDRSAALAPDRRLLGGRRPSRRAMRCGILSRRRVGEGNSPNLVSLAAYPASASPMLGRCGFNSDNEALKSADRGHAPRPRRWLPWSTTANGRPRRGPGSHRQREKIRIILDMKVDGLRRDARPFLANSCR